MKPQISIKERQRPYAIRPGVGFLLPRTPLLVRAYPTRLEIHHLLTQENVVYAIGFSGGAPDFFHIEQDLERGWLKILQHNSSAKSIYQLVLEEGRVELQLKRGGPLTCDGQEFSSGEALSLLELSQEQWTSSIPLERFSTGITRKQEVGALFQRHDVREWLPHWFRLGGWVPSTSLPPGPSLIHSAQEEALRADGVALAEVLRRLFRVGFCEGFLPMTQDPQRWGEELPPLPAKARDPLPLLVEGRSLIRSCFLQEKTPGHLSLLPLLLPPLHAGRMTSLAFSGGELDLEWSKKRLRRVAIRPSHAGEVSLNLPSRVRRFRLRTFSVSCTSLLRLSLLDRETPISLSPEETLFLDRFEG